MMAEGYAWVITDGLTGPLGSIHPPQGVIGLAPHVPSTARLRDVRKRWAHKFMRQHRDADLAQAEMGCYALWAYDAAWAVASAAERLVSPGDQPSLQGLVGGRSGPTDFSGLGKSMSGAKFLAAITSTTFEGLGGRFELINGELAVPAFRIVNIMDDARERGIGFWTRKGGLHRQLGRRGIASNSGLLPVIWPADSTVVPIGWVQPTSGRKLQVAVLGRVDPGYWPIMHLDVDPATNRTVAGGFVIEVFEAAVRLLPYALPFEYVLVGSMRYDTLVERVGKGEFDAAVADITITANRSQHVDFTLPYMSSGISMVVPMRDQRSKRAAWVFLKPLRYDLWLISFAFFVFTGFVVWAIEHRSNEEFRGPPSYQIGTLLYFGFSTLVFAHRENLKSNLSRFVVVVWVFVVLILQSSYTASLTSMLTVPQLEPAIGDFASLWPGTDKVGIMNNSFMREAMTKTGFPQYRLRPYQATQSFHEALLNGTIGAIVDETLYLRLFLNSYCDNFTQIAQSNKTGGFGFAFPKGSPYVGDLSRAILNLTESDELSSIERKWFGDADGCAAQGSPFTSASLSFDSFWGLFLITGATSLFCCALHLLLFVVANRRRICAARVPWRIRLRVVLKLLDDKDLSSHTFRTIKDGGGSVAGRSAGAHDAGASPAVARIAAGSPLSVSNHTYDMSEWSFGAQSPAPAAAGEIELAGAGEAGEVAAAPPTLAAARGSSDQSGTVVHQASN